MPSRPSLNPRDVLSAAPDVAARFLGLVMLGAAQADAEGATPGNARFLSAFDDFSPGLVLGVASDLAKHYVLNERAPAPHDEMVLFLARFNAHALDLRVRGYHPQMLADPVGAAHWEVASAGEPIEPYSSWLFEAAPLALCSNPFVLQSAALGVNAPALLYPEALEVWRRASPEFFRLARPFLTTGLN